MTRIYRFLLTILIILSLIHDAWIRSLTADGTALTVIDSYWGTAGRPVKAYPGTQSNTLTIVLRNELYSNITAATGMLNLPQGFTDIYGESEAVSSWSGVAKPGGTITLTYQVDIARDVSPGVYYANLTVEYTLSDGVRGVEYGLNVSLHIDPVPKVNLALAGCFWGEAGRIDLAVPGSRDLTLTIQIANLDIYDLTGVTATLLLPSGLSGRYRENALNCIIGALPIGGFGTAIFRGIYISDMIAEIYGVSSSIITPIAKLTIEYTLNLEGKFIRDSLSLNVAIPIYTYKPSSICLSGSYWSYRGEPVVPIPGAANIDLTITLVNLGEYPVSASAVSIGIPQGFTVKTIRPGALQPIASGGSSSITITFDISRDLKPGSYTVRLSIDYILESGGGGAVSTSTFDLPVKLFDPSTIDTILELASIYWGSPGNPIDAVPGAQNIPLTVELINRGIYTAEGITVEYLLPYGFKYSQSFKTTSRVSILNPGSTSTATIEIDLDPGLKPDVYSVSLIVEYIVSYAGSSLSKVRIFPCNVTVEKFPTGYGYLELASVSWGEGLPVYPGDENVTLALSFVNRAPYSISGVYLRVTLPDGFRLRDPQGVYVPGSIARYSSRSVNLQVSIGRDVKPGIYKGRILCEYILESGSYGVKLSESYEFNVTVNTLDGSVEFIQSLWYGVSAGPGDTGVQLIVTLRNIAVPSMNGVVGRLKMPDGFILSTTSEREGYVTPVVLTRPISIQSIAMGVIPPAIPLEVQPAATVSLGDYIYFVIPLSISQTVTPGVYYFDLTLSFLDQWNTLQKVDVKCKLHLLGSVKLIEVEPVSTEVVIGGYRRFSVKVVNNGSSPVYDVYFIILNIPPGIALEKQIFYKPVIEAGSFTIIETDVYGNPNTPYRGTLTALAMIAFKDSYGYNRRYNVTFPITVRGGIEFKMLESMVIPSPAYPGASITVSGILLNVGRETAKHVMVYIAENPGFKLKTGSRQYLGSIDPDAQIPFSVEAEVEVDKGVYTLQLKVDYTDEYGGVYSDEYSLEVEVGEPPKPQQQPMEVMLYRLLPIIVASIFMVVVGYLIIRYVRHARETGS